MVLPETTPAGGKDVKFDESLSLQDQSSETSKEIETGAVNLEETPKVDNHKTENLNKEFHAEVTKNMDNSLEKDSTTSDVDISNKMTKCDDTFEKSNQTISDKTAQNSNKSDQKLEISVETLKISTPQQSDEEIVKTFNENEKNDGDNVIYSSITDADKMDLDTSGDSVDKLLANLDELVKNDDKNILSVPEKLEVSYRKSDENKVQEAQEPKTLENLGENSKATKSSTIEEKMTKISHIDTSKIEVCEATNKISAKDNNVPTPIKVQQHRLSEPDMMIDIPTQEYSDIDSDENFNDSFDTDNDKNTFKNIPVKEENNFDFSIGTLVAELDKQVATLEKEIKTEPVSEENATDIEINSNQSSSKEVLSFPKHLESLPKAIEPLPSSSVVEVQNASKDEETLSKKTEKSTKVAESIPSATEAESLCPKISTEKETKGSTKITAMALPTEAVAVSTETESLSKELKAIPSTSSCSKSSNEAISILKEIKNAVAETIPSISGTELSKEVVSVSKEEEPKPSTSKELENISKETESVSEEPEPIPCASNKPETLSKETESVSKEAEPLPSTSKELEDISKETESVSKEVEPMPCAANKPETLSKENESVSNEVEPIPCASSKPETLSKETEPVSEEAESIPSTSKELEDISKETESDSQEVEPIPCASSKPETLSKETESVSEEAEPIPSTSKQLEALSKETLESSDKVPEVRAESELPEVDTMDSLGLLAESSRVIVEDDGDDPDTPEEDDEDDDDRDPNYDESSNMAEELSDNQSGDASEDSNDLPKIQLKMSHPQSSGEDTNTYIEDLTDTTDDNSMQYDGIQNKTLGFSISMENSLTNDIDISETTIKGMDNIDIKSETLTNDIDISEVQLESTDDVDISVVKLEEKMESVASEKTVPDSDKGPKLKSPPKSTEKESFKSKNTILENLLSKDSTLTGSLTKDIMSKTKTLEVVKPKDIVNIVDLEESSSEDDVQISTPLTEESDKVTSVNLPSDIDIDIMSSKRIVSDITTIKGEIIISGVPKPKPTQHKARLNTGELSIKTSSSASSEPTLVIPETKIGETSGDGKGSKINFNMEVFSLDSDSDESAPAKEKAKSPVKRDMDQRKRKCVNPACKSGIDAAYFAANFSVMNHFECTKKKKGAVCVNCFKEVENRASKLIEGIKYFTPLLELKMKKIAPDLVEISDSDSEDEQEAAGAEKIGFDAVVELGPQLVDMLNETWIKYRMDERLEEAQQSFQEDMARIDKEHAEIHRMIDDCQVLTDKLRDDLYGTFEPEKKSLESVIIYDINDTTYVCPEHEVKPHEVKEYVTRSSKRKLSAEQEIPSKRPAIPLGWTTLDKDKATVNHETAPTETNMDDDQTEDVSVVELSAEEAPRDLPPAGDIVRPPLTPAAPVYAMRNAFGSWVKARVVDITPKALAQPPSQFTIVRVKFDNKQTKTPYKVLPARCIAYDDPPQVRMTIGTRCIALFKDNVSANKRESYYSGVVAEVPNPVNKFRYLVFFDDGYAQYVQHKDTRLVVESSSLVWEEVHPFSREFVREYLLAYPERPMVRMHRGQNIKTEWNGKWWVSKVIDVDSSLVHVHFTEDDRTEWIYRGSTRLAPMFLELQSAERTRSRPLPRNRLIRQINMPYVEYTRSDDKDAEMASAEKRRVMQERERLEQEIRNQRAVAKKSTAPAPHPASAAAASETVTSRVVYYTPKNAVKPYKMVTHTCSPKCKRTDTLALSDLRTYNPLAKPLLSGWERQIVRFKGHKEVVYRAPCGRRLRDVADLHKYLRMTRSDMAVDLFDFSVATHCLAEFVLNKCIVGKKDLSHGKENVPVPCVNYYDDSLPEFCSYNTERTPTAGVPLNIDPDFLCGCDCTDDCQDKSKCACWKMTLEGARTIGMDPLRVGYVYKRLPEPLPSGIYECNSRCKCKHTCLNRVAQHPLQLKLQVFKTLNRGWGIRALNDVPKGAFLCVYAGNLLTDATANLDGLNEGDEYLAELDYIEVVEQMKEGFEDDIPKKDKRLDKKDSKQETSEEDELSSSSEDEEPSKSEKNDENFQPGYIPQPSGHTEFQKRLRRRDKKVKNDDDKNDATEKKDTKSEKGDDCITISDDEELREPSRFTAQAGMDDSKFISKYQSVRELYGKDEACYIMDAKVQGNIGRYLNHSCTPNVFVQNVFVDTHDPRFPWVAFFALSHIKAGTELTWNYNYDIGSVPGKTLYCYCGAVNCRGRLL